MSKLDREYCKLEDREESLEEALFYYQHSFPGDDISSQKNNILSELSKVRTRMSEIEEITE